MTTPHRGRGNRNAAKPPSRRRVALSLRVQPETRARLETLAQTHGSISRAVDHLADAENFQHVSRGNSTDCHP